MTSHISYDSFKKEKLQELFQHVKEHFLNVEIQVIGLGSGKTLAGLVRHLSNLSEKKSRRFIASSLQIRLEAEQVDLNIIDENQVMNIQVLFDGADQIDSEYHMIKGGGGALFREKILFEAAQKLVIVAESGKYVNKLNRAVPIEVHPFARTLFGRKLIDLEAKVVDCKLRTLDKGFPFFTENGNIIFDVSFDSITSIKRMYAEIKSIPGVVEVGLFARPNNVCYYKIHPDDSFEVIRFE
ncbi:MAG: ribose 5-phosphate isomerase A [Nitrososphaeraceae archaeon]|nr:ribose 5-phosphate isomerase A [Nitrososphaeraceae archaeon]